MFFCAAQYYVRYFFSVLTPTLINSCRSHLSRQVIWTYLSLIEFVSKSGTPSLMVDQYFPNTFPTNSHQLGGNIPFSNTQLAALEVRLEGTHQHPVDGMAQKNPQQIAGSSSAFGTWRFIHFWDIQRLGPMLRSGYEWIRTGHPIRKDSCFDGPGWQGKQHPWQVALSEKIVFAKKTVLTWGAHPWFLDTPDCKSGIMPNLHQASSLQGHWAVAQQKNLPTNGGWKGVLFHAPMVAAFGDGIGCCKKTRKKKQMVPCTTGNTADCAMVNDTTPELNYARAQGLGTMSRRPPKEDEVECSTLILR